MPLRREYVSDRWIGFPVEQLPVDALHVLRAGAVLDSQPIPSPLDIRVPGLGEALVDSLGSPVLRALAETVWGEEENGLGAGQLGSAAEFLAMGDPDGGGVLQLIRQVAVDGAPHLRVA